MFNKRRNPYEEQKNYNNNISCFSIILWNDRFEATTKSRTSETNWERMVKEEEIRKETERLRIEQYHKDEMERFLNDIDIEKVVIVIISQTLGDIWVDTNLVNQP